MGIPDYRIYCSYRSFWILSLSEAFWASKGGRSGVEGFGGLVIFGINIYYESPILYSS